MVMTSINLSRETLEKVDVLSGVFDGGNRSRFLERVINEVFADSKIQEDVKRIAELQREIMRRFIKEAPEEARRVSE